MAEQKNQQRSDRTKFDFIEESMDGIVRKAGQIKHYEELQAEVMDPDTGDDMGVGERIKGFKDEQRQLAAGIDGIDDRGTVRPRLMLSYLSQLAAQSPNMPKEVQAILAQAMVLAVAPFIATGNPEQSKVISKWEKDFPNLPLGILSGNRQLQNA